MTDPFSDWRSRKTAAEALARRILQVEEGATLPELKRAFRRMARLTHPDLNPDREKSHARFLNIKAAYLVLARGADEPLSDPGPVERLEGMDEEEYMRWWKSRWG